MPDTALNSRKIQSWIRRFSKNNIHQHLNSVFQRLHKYLPHSRRLCLHGGPTCPPRLLLGRFRRGAEPERVQIGIAHDETQSNGHAGKEFQPIAVGLAAGADPAHLALDFVAP